MAGSAIESTYHHPYWVVKGDDLTNRPEPDHVRAATVRDAIVPGRWVDAGDLRIGDVLLLQDGRRLPIEEIILRHATCRVYNLAVEGLRNYAVGPCSVLAHNMCAKALKPGPSTNPNSPHNATIRVHADLLEAGGNRIIAGGGRTPKLPEKLIPTPGGIKSGRRPDILYETPTGQLRGRNIGHVDAAGNPIKREMEALQDLNGPGGLPTDFVPF